MEWMFLTCHNYWVICRLVRDDDKPFLAYSPYFSIENSSEPFRAFLGAMLSVQGGVPVQASIFDPDMELDVISEEEESESLPEDDTHDGSESGAYRDGSRTSEVRSPATISHHATERGLMVRPSHTWSFLLFGSLVYSQITCSSPHFPDSFQVWVDLRPLPNNTFILPLCAENGSERRRLWLTRFIGSGSTGNVWQCRFDNSDSLFAVKVTEWLRRSDVQRQQRFCAEFEVYLTLEKAYQSGHLRDRIAPRCYGAFEGDRVNAFILELCDGTLMTWDELDSSER